MKLFFWQKNRAIDEFAYQLADELYSSVNPESITNFFENQSSGKSSEKKQTQLQQKVTRSLNNIIMRVAQYRELNKLGIYGKARLHMTFTERLKTLGYPANHAEEINKLVLLRTP